MSEVKQLEIPQIVTDRKNAYYQRRRKQMFAFFGATALTLLSSRIAYRGVQSRKYIPNMFNANHIPPPFSFQKDAISAVTHATFLALSSFSMAITAVCWTWNVSTIKEFTFKIKETLGGAESEKKISEMKLDEESSSLQEAINTFFEEELSQDVTEQNKK